MKGEIEIPVISGKAHPFPQKYTFTVRGGYVSTGVCLSTGGTPALLYQLLSCMGVPQSGL